MFISGEIFVVAIYHSSVTFRGGSAGQSNYIPPATANELQLCFLARIQQVEKDAFFNVHFHLAFLFSPFFSIVSLHLFLFLASHLVLNSEKD